MGRSTRLQSLRAFAPAWLVGSAVATVLAILMQTQNVIGRLNTIGADIGVGARLSMSGYDLFRLGSVYIFIVAIGLLIAFFVGASLYRALGFGRWAIFSVAGAVALLTIQYAFKEAYFGIFMIAGARDGFGIGLQMIAGAVGGLVFAAMTSRQIGVRRDDA